MKETTTDARSACAPLTFSSSTTGTEERKEVLADLLHWPHGGIAVNENFPGDGATTATPAGSVVRVLSANGSARPIALAARRIWIKALGGELAQPRIATLWFLTAKLIYDNRVGQEILTRSPPPRNDAERAEFIDEPAEVTLPL